ncbi:Permeases of the major facilitator superfamily [Nostoc sphaeroides CCNUC1]|uniref:Permeases of the major facilitator superfamily n=1 Tax=Nostoc sphaeroides CCNUC1 TaxID=2653204 RepID=A0A5P8W597_9NOSO|nr:Permeases of the major facilitator superfamily [Nostoc sphaeroides CCNUC1]
MNNSNGIFFYLEVPKFRDYRLFTIGRLVLFVGSQMQTVAIG